MSLHRVISCHPDLFTKPRDPRISSQSSITIDSDVPDDSSLSETNSTVISLETAESLSVSADSRLDLEEYANLSDITLHDSQENIESSKDAQTTENSLKQSEKNPHSIYNMETVEAPSHVSTKGCETEILDLDSDTPKRAFDVNCNVNESGNDAQRINGVTKDLNENYNLHSVNPSGS